LLGAAWLLLPGHSPYKQWYVYRAKHVVVVADRSRPGAFSTATAVAAAVAAQWPQSKAVAAAARSSRDIVSMLETGQLQVAVLSCAVALEAIEGRGAFAESGKVPLRALAVLGDEVVVTVEGYPADRAALIAQALAESGRWTAAQPPQGFSIPFHRGALDYYARRRGA
jgi:TRAP-type uncharacterized transport system substrate-binding protein